MEESKFKFPPAVWRETSKDEEWVLEYPESDLVLTTYNDKNWHVAKRGERTGMLLGEEEGVHTLQDAKDRVHASACRRIKNKYLRAKGDIARIESCYMETEGESK